MPIANPITVSYPDFTGRLANAIVYPNPVSYPAISTVQVDTRYNSDNRVYTPSVSTTYIYPKTALLVQSVDTGSINSSPFGDNSASDAFGRLRVGLPATLLDSKMLYDKLPSKYDEKVNLGSSTFVPGDSLVSMQTSAVSGYVIRQTSDRFNYQPGKSMTASMTFVAAPETNIIKRIGLFQGLSAAPYLPSDGLYLEITENGPSFNIAKTVNGITTTTTIPQSSWNVDKLDGSGASEITIDFTKGQIFNVDYEWLGLGRVRFGFYLKGKLYYAHYVNNFNTLTSPYMTSSNQPVRYEIRQTGAGSGVLKQICATVIDEGTKEILGTATTAATSGTITAQNGVMTPILSLRLSPTRSNLALSLKDFFIYNTDNTTNAKYTLYRGSAVTGGSLTWNDVDSAGLQYAYGSSSLTVSGGYPLYSGFIPKSQGTAAGTGVQSIEELVGTFGTKIDGTPEILTIAVLGLGATVPVYIAANAFINS